MSKKYLVEVQLTKKGWVCVDTFVVYADALEYIHQNSDERYPMRITRVVKTIIFEEKKSGK